MGDGPRPVAAVGGGRGQDRLPFAAGYPADDELDDLVRAFEAGDYGRVRTDALVLASRTDDPRVADAARDLARRVHADPTAIFLLLLSVGLLAYLFAHYLMARA